MKIFWMILLSLLLSASVASGTTIKDEMTFTNVITFEGDVVKTFTEQYTQGVAACYTGATAGWTAAWDQGVDIYRVTLAASKTGSSLVCPVTVPIKIGATLTSFSIIGQAESGGNSVIMQVGLYKNTAVTAGNTQANIGVLDLVGVDEDTQLLNEADAFTPTVVTTADSFYFLFTATTGSSTDLDMIGFTITLKQN